MEGSLKKAKKAFGSWRSIHTWATLISFFLCPTLNSFNRYKEIFMNKINLLLAASVFCFCGEHLLAMQEEDALPS